MIIFAITCVGVNLFWTKFGVNFQSCNVLLIIVLFYMYVGLSGYHKSFLEPLVERSRLFRYILIWKVVMYFERRNVNGHVRFSGLILMIFSSVIYTMILYRELGR